LVLLGRLLKPFQSRTPLVSQVHDTSSSGYDSDICTSLFCTGERTVSCSRDGEEVMSSWWPSLFSCDEVAMDEGCF
ncbi:hypothetical protein A2U01_0068839, partial [Trifolium medium]|nr:hypothetical protein [Trifolium medium]